jgi:hypothetical protein
MTGAMVTRSMVLGLFGLALSGCSLAGPSHTFTANNSSTAAAAGPQTTDASDAKDKHKKGNKSDLGDAPQQPRDPGSALAAAENFCRDTTRDKGIKSVLSLLTHLRPGAFHEDYVACMKSRGYEVTQ